MQFATCPWCTKAEVGQDDHFWGSNVTKRCKNTKKDATQRAEWLTLMRANPFGVLKLSSNGSPGTAHLRCSAGTPNGRFHLTTFFPPLMTVCRLQGVALRQEDKRPVYLFKNSRPVHLGLRAASAYLVSQRNPSPASAPSSCPPSPCPARTPHPITLPDERRQARKLPEASQF